MRFIVVFIMGFFLGNIVSSMADSISSPPALRDSNVALQHYLKEIYDNIHRLQVVETNPDGTRSGKKGDMVLLQTGGTSYLEINTDSATTWRGVALADTP